MILSKDDYSILLYQSRAAEFQQKEQTLFWALPFQSYFEPISLLFFIKIENILSNILFAFSKFLGI